MKIEGNLNLIWCINYFLTSDIRCIIKATVAGAINLLSKVIFNVEFLRATVVSIHRNNCRTFKRGC